MHIVVFIMEDEFKEHFVHLVLFHTYNYIMLRYCFVQIYTYNYIMLLFVSYVVNIVNTEFNHAHSYGWFS